MNARALTLGTSLREAPHVGAVVSHGVGRGLAMLALWRERSRQRRQVARWARMSGESFYRDTSLTRCEVAEETSKPFWKP